jgi:hypothetical protein
VAEQPAHVFHVLHCLLNAFHRHRQFLIFCSWPSWAGLACPAGPLTTTMPRSRPSLLPAGGQFRIPASRVPDLAVSRGAALTRLTGRPGDPP